MADNHQRFVSRFQSMFDHDGLCDVKFFLKPGHTPSGDQFEQEVNQMFDAITETRIKRIKSVDGHYEQKRFDDPF